MLGVSMAHVREKKPVLTLRLVVCRHHLPVWDTPSPILDEEVDSTKGLDAESHGAEEYSI